MKIAIIGNAGSGKSSLGLIVHKLLGLPLYHLDQYFWKPGWIEPDRTEFEKIHTQLCDQGVDVPAESLSEGWIIEGMAVRFLEYRIQKSDIIIFLDMPTYMCLYRILKRAFTHFGCEYFASAKGCPERGPSFRFLKFIWHFNAEKRPVIIRLLEKYKDQKKIFVIKNRTELDNCIKSFDGKSNG